MQVILEQEIDLLFYYNSEFKSFILSFGVVINSRVHSDFRSFGVLEKW